MDSSILPSVNDLEVKSVDDIPKQEIVHDFNKVHDDIFVAKTSKKKITRKSSKKPKTKKIDIEVEKEVEEEVDTLKKELTDSEKKKIKQKAHLDKIREKAIIKRHGTVEERAERKRLKDLEKEEKKKEREKKREERLERQRQQARQRYWDKKAKEEIDQQKTINKPKPKNTSPPPQPTSSSNQMNYDTFAKYMTQYEESKPKKETKKEKSKEPQYPSLFNHLDIW